MLKAKNKLTALPTGNGFRVKVPLPSLGDCWFSVDDTQSVESFLEEVKAEDKLITKISAEVPVSSNFNQLVHKSPISLTINERLFEIKASELTKLKYETSTLKNFVSSITSYSPSNQKELENSLRKSLSLLGEQSMEFLSDLKSQLNQVEHELEKIKQQEKQIVQKINSSANLRMGAGLSLVVGNFGFFYYTIYCVEWLGWDLMEPITYSVGQGTFILGLYYYLKSRQEFTYDNMLSSYQNQNLDKQREVHGIPKARLNSLIQEKQNLQSTIDLIESRMLHVPKNNSNSN